MSDEHHFIQRNILNDLLFGDQLKYSQLKPEDMEGSQFTFHLTKLIDYGLIIKVNELYQLTAKGKNVANTFDKDSINPNRQAKQSVVFCAFRQLEGERQTLIYTRKKNPFYNHQGYPTGKVMYGESVVETAERELNEETGLSGRAKLVGVRHFRVYYPTPNDLVEDKVMYVCKIEEPSGEFISNKEGEFKWVDISKIHSVVVNPLPEFKEIFDIVSKFTDKITFGEGKHYPKQF